MLARAMCKKHNVSLIGNPSWFCQINEVEAVDGHPLWRPSLNDMWCPSDGDGNIINGECNELDDWDMELVKD